MRFGQNLAAWVNIPICALSLMCLFAAAPTATANVLFDGEWTDFAPFYGPGGWHNGTNAAYPHGPANMGADTGIWGEDNVSFFGSHNPWLQMHAHAPDRIKLEIDTSSPKHGMVARFEVRPGDYSISGDRAELGVMWRNGSRFPVNASSGHEYYGISVKLSADWRPPSSDIRYPGLIWGSILQLHSPDVFAAPPAIALSVTDNFHLTMDSGDLLDGGNRKRNKDNVEYPFTNSSLRPGHWIEFMLDIQWALDSTGSVVIYRRDEGESAFSCILRLNNLPTLTSRFGKDPGNSQHYWAVGYYRARNAKGINVVWIGPVVRGTTFDDVALAAFGATGPR